MTKKKKGRFLSNLLHPQTDRYLNKRNAPAVPIEVMAENLKKLPDAFWGLYAFESDPIKGKIDLQTRMRLIDISNNCGREYAQACLASGKKEVRKLAADLGIDVQFQPRPGFWALEGSRVLFAQYFTNGKIEVYTDNLDKMETLLAQSAVSKILNTQNVADVLLGHEVFHYFEDRDYKTIPTENEKVNLSPFKLIANNSRVECLGEIAAMQFAKTLLDLEYSPFLFDVIFTYNYDKQAAYDLYDSILALASQSQDVWNPQLLSVMA